MGINNLSASSINEFTSLSAQTIPNVPVTIQAYSPNGWTAGDYLYNSASGVVGAPSGTASAGGPIVTLQATNLTVSGGLVSGNQVLSNPLKTTITYSGTSLVPDQNIFTNQISATDVASTSSCSMTNGNIAVGFYESTGAQPGYYYAIYDQSGNIVVSKTFIDNVAGFNLVILIALAEGGFAYGYYTNDNQRWNVRIYSATGTQISSSFRSLSTNARPNYALYCNKGIQTTDGGLVFAWFNSAYICYAKFNNQANNYVGQASGRPGDGTLYSNQLTSFALYPLAADHPSYPNGFVLSVYNSDYSQTKHCTLNSSGSVVYNGNQLSTMYDGIDVMRCQDGTYVAIYGNSGNTLLAAKPTVNSNGALVINSSVTVSTDFYRSSYSYANLIPMQGSGFAAFFTSYGGYNVVYRRSNTTSSALTFGSELPLYGYNNYPYNALKFVCGTNAGIYSCYYDGSGYASFAGTSTQTITNGTVYTATALTPPNYTFLGIAQQTTAAGTVGNVIVNGNATANSNMPNVSGTVYFDTTQTNMFGNKGYVTGRNFVLKGLE